MSFWNLNRPVADVGRVTRLVSVRLADRAEARCRLVVVFAEPQTQSVADHVGDWHAQAMGAALAGLYTPGVAGSEQALIAELRRSAPGRFPRVQSLNVLALHVVGVTSSGTSGSMGAVRPASEVPPSGARTSGQHLLELALVDARNGLLSPPPVPPSTLPSGRISTSRLPAVGAAATSQSASMRAVSLPLPPAAPRGEGSARPPASASRVPPARASEPSARPPASPSSARVPSARASEPSARPPASPSSARVPSARASEPSARPPASPSSARVPSARASEPSARSQVAAPVPVAPAPAPVAREVDAVLPAVAEQVGAALAPAVRDAASKVAFAALCAHRALRQGATVEAASAGLSEREEIRAAYGADRVRAVVREAAIASTFLAHLALPMAGVIGKQAVAAIEATCRLAFPGVDVASQLGRYLHAGDDTASAELARQVTALLDGDGDPTALREVLAPLLSSLEPLLLGAAAGARG